MAVATRQNREAMSLESYERIPEGPPYFDYIDGEAILVNKPSGKHQLIQLEIAHALKRFVRSENLGLVYPEIDVRLPNGNWVGPDVTFISNEQVHLYDEVKGDFYGAPDLVVEITSPSNEDYDRYEKFDQYRRCRVPTVWLIDQRTLVIEEFVHTPTGYLRLTETQAGEVFRSQVLQGFEVDLKAVL